MNKDQYIVEGLNNEMAKENLKRALEIIEGVNGVFIDLGRNNLEILCDSNVDLERVRDCIENTTHKLQ
ncbi:hypothetical protein SAMN04487886_102129 [Clostridium sp. DSM 8431]|uniref:hypothetical protein n=1 Tax=Clostridium sp. DSM 8431 TaxID=1761781 RepID=UPI0008EC3CD8|nr:hypothetical protein [Clostridium sp. DSM 8431]SFU41204.1 hypothetical protein SAMN04487886_102129 [Clostridium sp. DSM 8431]